MVGCFLSNRQKFQWDELIPLLLPASMFLLGNSSLTIFNIFKIIAIWQLIIIAGSFIYSVVAVNAGHHAPIIFHEGDEVKGLDFGIYQLAATIDRIGAQHNLFISLTHFGNHVMHHLFPSLDHCLLTQLKGTLVDTCKEFEHELRELSLWDAMVGQFQQLSRTKPFKLSKSKNGTSKRTSQTRSL